MTIGLLRYIARNVGDLATLSTVVAAYTGTPVANLQNNKRARVFRHPLTGSPTGNTVLGTFNGDSYYASGIGLDRINFSSSALLRVQGFSTSDWTGVAAADTGFFSPYNSSALGPFTWGQTALGVDIKDGYLGYRYMMAYFTRALIKSFRIDYSDGANSDGYNEIGRLVLGDYSQIGYSASFGIRFGWQENTTHEEMDGGTIIADGRLPRRIITGAMPALTAGERTALADAMRFVGMRKNFMFSVQAGEGASLERDFTILQGKFSRMPELSWDLPEYHSSQFEIVES